MDNKQKALAAGAAFLLTAGVAVGTWFYTRPSKKAQPSGAAADQGAQQAAAQEEIKVDDVVVDPNWPGFEDPSFNTNHYLSKIEANSRSQYVSDVNYLLALGFVKGGETFHGKVTIDYNLSKKTGDFVVDGDNTECLFIDYKGKMIKSLTVNGKALGPDTPNVWKQHRIYIPNAHQKIGQNRCVVEFETFFVTDCQGMQYFRDDADGSEYIYSELEPDYCHIIFPCFDQPDLKATHKTCIVAPSDWEVITNSERIGVTAAATVANDTQDVKAALKRFEIPSDSPILSSFSGDAIKVHEFERTKKISTYLFAFVAGPFDFLEPSAERTAELPNVPMRLYCRKSLTKYAEKMKDDWFRVTKASIRYYEKMFDQPYPFDKLDSIMCPDYAMGAMENVGCITYNDDYVQRDENFTRYKQENIFNTVAHEISHQWFGNLVTMKWWDDLWLNESFANTVSYMAMDEAEGMEDISLAWNIFIDEQFSGLSEDQKNTSHPIASKVPHTGAAQDIFDGISYGKGAAFLHQMIFFLGKDLLKDGLKTYFAKYKFKNTELKDFIAELADAAKRAGMDIDFTAWSESWLTKAGCAEIKLDFDRDATTGVLSNLKLVQTPYNVENTPENCLRRQAINIASLDDQMQVIDIHRVETSDSVSVTSIADKFVGPQDKRIHAFLINYGCHGYGKFQVDPMTLTALETGLHKVKESRERKNLMNVMYDLIKSGSLPAAHVLRIIINNLEHETAVDILQDTFRFIVPCILSKFLHEEINEARSSEMFNLTLRIMTSGRFNEFPAAMEMLLSSAIGFATTQDEITLVYKWFTLGKITSAKGKAIEGADINVKVRHTLIRKMFGTTHIPHAQKKECFAQLAKMDQSDMLGRTEKFCEAANPDARSKKEAFMQIFEGSDDMSLQHVQEMCRGYRQYGQRDLIDTFTEEFFNRIEDCVNTKSWSLTRYIYIFLAPGMKATAEDLKKFQVLLSKMEAYSEAERKEGTMRLTNWVKDSMKEIEEKIAARELSRQWERTQQDQASL